MCEPKAVTTKHAAKTVRAGWYEYRGYSICLDDKARTKRHVNPMSKWGIWQGTHILSAKYITSTYSLKKAKEIIDGREGKE